MRGSGGVLPHPEFQSFTFQLELGEVVRADQFEDPLDIFEFHHSPAGPRRPAAPPGLPDSRPSISLGPVPGRVEHDVIETEPLFVRDGERLVRTQGMPSRMEAFARAGLDVVGMLRAAD